MYRTKQMEILIDYFERNPDKQYSAKEITEKICDNNSVGKSTVYRLINKLVNEGSIRRFRGDNAKSVVYQYVGRHRECDRHFHLKCVNCGLLVHLDCSYMKNFNEHIYSHHKFSIDASKAVLYVICEKCSQGVKL